MAPPLHETLHDELLQRIRDGRWAPGEPIPSETRLCEEFGVSRGPVRQALSRLRREGLVVGGPGRPPRVVREVPAQPVNVFVSFTQWAEAAGLDPGSHTLEIARRVVDADTAALVGIDEGDPVVQLLRVRTLAGVPVMLERTTWVDAVGRHLLDIDTDSGSTYAALTRAGVDLFAATHVLDAVGADDMDAAHLRIDPGTPLLRERRTTVDSAGVVLEHSDDRYLPQHATFVVHNRRRDQGHLGLVAPTAPCPD